MFGAFRSHSLLIAEKHNAFENGLQMFGAIWKIIFS